MKKWNLFTIQLLILLNFSPLLADCYQSVPSYEWRQAGHWFEIECDYLYWKPCADELDLAAIVKENGDVTRVTYKDLCAKWQSGFRVSVWLPDVLYGWDVSVSYLRLNYDHLIHQKDGDFDDDNGIISPLAFPAGDFLQVWGEGEEELELLYNEWDLLVTFNLCETPCHHLAIYTGVAGAFFNQEVEAEFSNLDDTILEIDWHSEYSGVGIRTGTLYEWNISRCLQFFARGDMTLLTGEGGATNEQELFVDLDSEETITITDDDCCHFIWGYHIKTGLSYQTCICQWEYAIEIGYEFFGWHNTPNHRVFLGKNKNTEAGYSTSPRKRTLGFHGLFAGISTHF